MKVFVEGIPLVDHPLSKNFSLKKSLRAAEKRVQDYLNTFSCEENADVDLFLKKRSVEFHKKCNTRTYLIIANDTSIVGYFAIGMKPLVLPKTFSSTRERKRYNPYTCKEGEIISTFLIGQIGRATGYPKSQLNLAHFTSYIFNIFDEVRDRIGGRVILIEVEKENEKLVSHYQENGFEVIQSDDASLTQLLQLNPS